MSAWVTWSTYRRSQPRVGAANPAVVPGVGRRAASTSAATSTSSRRAGTSSTIVSPVSHQAERSPGGGFGRDVQDDRAVGRAAHPAIADPHHVAHALLRAAWPAAARSRPPASPGSPSGRSRAGRARCRRRRRGRGRRCARGSPRCCRTRPPGPGAGAGAGVAAAGLMIAPRGARLPRRTAIPAAAWSGSVRGRMTVASQIRGVVEVTDQRPAGDGHRGRVEQVPHLAQDGEQPTGAVEVLHEVLAGRLQVDEQRHVGCRSGRSRRSRARCRAGRRWPAGARPRSSSRRWPRAPRSRSGTSARLRIVLGRRSASTISIARRPACVGRLRAAGCPAPASRPRPGSSCPSASATQAMVEAVPIVLQ